MEVLGICFGIVAQENSYWDTKDAVARESLETTALQCTDSYHWYACWFKKWNYVTKLDRNDNFTNTMPFSCLTFLQQ
jgi:hypothetical protein